VIGRVFETQERKKEGRRRVGSYTCADLIISRDMSQFSLPFDFFFSFFGFNPKKEKKKRKKN